MIFFSTLVSSHIRFLLESLDDFNYDDILGELLQFVDYGSKESILLLWTCLDHMNFNGDDGHKMQLRPDVLAAIFRYLLDQPNFSTVFCESLRNMVISEKFLRELCDAIHLSIFEKLALGLALADAENIEMRTCGQNFCTVQIEELCRNLAPIDSTKQIQNIITFLYQSEDLAKHLDSFMQILSLMDLKDGTPLILAPLLPNNSQEATFTRNLDLFYSCSEIEFDAIIAEMENETSMADIMRELGYGCTVSSSHCKEILSLSSSLPEVTLSRIISTIARTYTEDNQSYSIFCSAIGSSTTSDFSNFSNWNFDVLIDSIQQLAPGTNWMCVMEFLDHEGFYIPNEDAFSLFMSIYARACQDPFPLHTVCGSVWRNSDGQLSFLRHAVSAPPEIFSFAHSIRKLKYNDMLRGYELPHGLANHAWLSLDLLGVLCQLAEMGHASSVKAMLEFPLKHSPEILLLGVAQIDTAYNLLQCYVYSTVFPLMVSNAMESVILHLWHAHSKLVICWFIDMIIADQGNMLKILDICQELKILQLLLEQSPFSYGIRLAALATQKEYISLEAWLNDNLSIYQDIFFEECLNFLKEITFDAVDDVSANLFQSSGAVLNSHAGTSSTVLKVLQANANRITSDHLAEELKRIQGVSLPVSPRLQNVGASDSSPEVYADGIEGEANFYFHQIFSGEVPIDLMVQTLARLKESPEKRDRSMFECMIQNLFKEYRFFPRYPEKQLKIAAVLFGSLINHRLATHLTLGFALSGVLDALCKPPDSKIFTFGTKALEQFLDRLVELPQYCKHILLIPHLHATHPEIVEFIKHALDRTPSGHSKRNSVNSAFSDPHGDSAHCAQGTPENAELLESGNLQPGQQLSSSLQMQQRHQVFLGDQLRESTTSNSYAPQLSPPTGHPANNPASDAQSSQTATNASAAATVSSGFLHSSRGITSTRFGSALNVETLMAAAEKRDTPIETPASDIQDKILFMINNISTSNIDTKAKEFTETLSEKYYPWFAQYMVMKRASIEPNFQNLYLEFLDKVNSKNLNKEIVKAAYENCKVLLRSELIKSSSGERSLLKNLGSLLGKLTIGRNQVLKAKEIDPKSLIIEAYEKGLMIAVIPFTSKILEACQSSLAYGPPNPWTMAILGLLAEIYSLPNLKMNLTFDIEVLFRNLGVNLKEVKPTSLLKNRVRAIEGNPDFSSKDVVASQLQVVPTLNQYAGGLHHPSAPLLEDEKMAALGLSDRLPLGQVAPLQSPYSLVQVPSPIPNIGRHIILNQKLSGLGLHYSQRIVTIAMERAIKEVIMSPIVQRSVDTAVQTTKQFVLKDYAMECNETHVYNAAHLMVASLAGSLAHVTCKEPLCVSISSQLRNAFKALNVANELLEQAVSLVMMDNLDLACAVVEHFTTRKAQQIIVSEIAGQLSLKRKHHDSVGSFFYGPRVSPQGSLHFVPENPRPLPAHLSYSQQRVYEDFVRFPWQNQSGQRLNAEPSGVHTSCGGFASTGLSRAYVSCARRNNPGFYSTGLGTAGLSAATQPLDLISEEMDPSSAQNLSVSLTHIGAIDGIIAHGAKMNSLASLSLNTAASERDSMESSNAEFGPTLSLPKNSAAEHVGGGISEPSLSMADVLEKYQIVAQKLETLVTKDSGEAEIQGVVAQIPVIILKCVNQDEVALAIAQKVFRSLYENASNTLHIDAHLSILAAIRDVCKLVVKELTRWVMYSVEERRFNANITVGLIRKDLLNLAEYDIHVAKLIDAGRNKAAVEFAINLLHTLLVHESSVCQLELPNLIDTLTKLASQPGSPESFQQLVEIAKNPVANAASLSGSVGKDGTKQAREKKGSDHLMTSREDYISIESVAVDPSFHDQVSMLLAEWHQICELHGTNDGACTHFVKQLQQNGYLNGDETSDQLFCVLTELSVAHCLPSEGFSSASWSIQSGQAASNLSFLTIDVYAKLVSLILRHFLMEHRPSRIPLWFKILSATVRVTERDAKEKKGHFNPFPYFRLFINWLSDLVTQDPVVDGSSFEVLITFANALHALQPLKVPAFSYAWLELLIHRSFMPKLLTVNAPKGWVYVQCLLVDLFKFMEPYLRNAELGEPIHFLYKGTLRVLLVLLHDFPEFLGVFHFSFCDVIPSTCIQMRNVILSAFPLNMRLPDPFTPNLKIDLLPEMHQPPPIFSEVDAALKTKQMKSDVDEYLKTRHQGSSFLSELKQKLLLPQNEAAQVGTRYDVPLINSLVLYVGLQLLQTIQQLQTNTPPPLAQQITHNGPLELYLMGPTLDIFQTLIVDMDTEGRYFFLSAIANQLRYPNNHTHFFSFVLLYLFNEANQEIIQEQITRVLLERLIVNKPHPWGLLITFIELIKNPRYNFWNHAFTRCAPAIEELFESFSRSYSGPKPVDESMLSGGIADNMH